MTDICQGSETIFFKTRKTVHSISLNSTPFWSIQI